jgi:hypothetical protein
LASPDIHALRDVAMALVARGIDTRVHRKLAPNARRLDTQSALKKRGEVEHHEREDNSIITGKRCAGRSQSRLFCTPGRVPGVVG